jgi:hypothetical protein
MTEQFSDEENAFLRHVRFGELPERVLPEDMVQLQETDDRPLMPDNIAPEEWNARLGFYG